MITDPVPLFDLRPSLPAQKRIRSQIARAKQLGIVDVAKDALRKIYSELTQSPRRWGDPVRIMGKLRLTEYRGFHWYLECRYWVHHDEPIVLLTDIFAVKDSPLFSSQ